MKIHIILYIKILYPRLDIKKCTRICAQNLIMIEIKFEDEGEVESSVSRVFFLDWLLYPIGGLLLGYGFLLKSRKAKNDDVLEAEIIS